MSYISNSSDGSQDQIVSISNAWIFDSNLDFALPSNKENLDWCCGVNQNGSTYDGCWEMACVVNCYQGKYVIKANDIIRKWIQIKNIHKQYKW